MTDNHEMQRCSDGVVRAVYTDSDGDRYIVIDGERQYLPSPEEDAGE